MVARNIVKVGQAALKYRKIGEISQTIAICRTSRTDFIQSISPN